MEAGSQIYKFFGSKCNSRYFVNYGFVVENNSENGAILHLELDKNDECYQMKKKQIKGNDCRFLVSKNYNEDSCKLFAFARMCQCTRKEFEEYSNKYMSVQSTPISIENEIKALEMIANAAQSHLKSFTTTMEQDEKLLANLTKYPISSNQRNIVVMRHGEKQVYHHYMQMQKIASQMLTTKQSIHRLQYGHHANGIQVYIKQVVLPLLQQ